MSHTHAQDPYQAAIAAWQTRCLDELLRIESALRDCGFDSWSVCQSKENPFLVMLQSSSQPGQWWFRPCWNVGPVFQLCLPADEACKVILEYAHERLDAGAHPDLFATEDDALELWERLNNLAESLASGGAA